MTVRSELIVVLRDAVKMCAPDIHFTRAESGDILISIVRGKLII